MKETNVTDRLTFLAKNFDVFTCDKGDLESKLSALEKEGYKPRPILTKGKKAEVLAILSVKENNRENGLKKVSISSNVFADVIAGDPTENKMYLQWMLNLFVRLLKGGSKESIEAAIRFVSEDLPQANAYITLFDNNKRKKKFLELSKVSYSLKNVTDPTDINQYKSLAQLFDAVDPFIEKEPSAVERQLNKFVAAKQALMPVKDRKFTLYIPKTTDASVVFDKFANWCTARASNGMFTSYTSGHKKPNGKNSDIYIIINNKFFSGESEEIYQIHFETGQIKDKKNANNVSIFKSVISESEGISNFFYEELMKMAKDNKKGIENNKYLDYLIEFGFAESLFEFLEVDTTTIKFMKREIPRLPDLSRFTCVDNLVITDAKLTEVHPSIGRLSKMDILSLANNNLSTLPKEIGALKNLSFINLVGNKMTDFPDEIRYLDKSNGGRLFKIAFDKNGISEAAYRKLKELLPNVEL